MWQVSYGAKGVPAYDKLRQSLDPAQHTPVEDPRRSLRFASLWCGIATPGFGPGPRWPTLDRTRMVHGVEAGSGEVEATVEAGGAGLTCAQAPIQTRAQTQGTWQPGGRGRGLPFGHGAEAGAHSSGAGCLGTCPQLGPGPRPATRSPHTA